MKGRESGLKCVWVGISSHSQYPVSILSDLGIHGQGITVGQTDSGTGWEEGM